MSDYPQTEKLFTEWCKFITGTGKEDPDDASTFEIDESNRMMQNICESFTNESHYCESKEEAHQVIGEALEELMSNNGGEDLMDVDAINKVLTKANSALRARKIN